MAQGAVGRKTPRMAPGRPGTRPRPHRGTARLTYGTTVTGHRPAFTRRIATDPMIR